jgi:hypothetical protein
MLHRVLVATCQNMLLIYGLKLFCFPLTENGSNGFDWSIQSNSDKSVLWNLESGRMVATD